MKSSFWLLLLQLLSPELAAAQSAPLRDFPTHASDPIARPSTSATQSQLHLIMVLDRAAVDACDLLGAWRCVQGGGPGLDLSAWPARIPPTSSPVPGFHDAVMRNEDGDSFWLVVGIGALIGAGVMAPESYRRYEDRSGCFGAVYCAIGIGFPVAAGAVVGAFVGGVAHEVAVAWKNPQRRR